MTQPHTFAPVLPQLALTFAARRGKTYLSAQRSTHPFHLCRVLYRPDDAPGVATVYMQGCAGGLFEHDRIEMSVRVERGARAHLTTAAATLAHRMPHGGHAEQRLRAYVCADALLEYCPDPLILFPASRVSTTVELTLERGARAILSDAFLGHRLEGDDTPFAWLKAATTVEDERRELLARESYRAIGSALRAQTPGVAGRYACQASVWVLGSGDMQRLRAALSALEGVTVGVTSLPALCGAIVRILAEDGVALRKALHASWSAARAALGELTGRARPK